MNTGALRDRPRRAGCGDACGEGDRLASGLRPRYTRSPLARAAFTATAFRCFAVAR